MHNPPNTVRRFMPRERGNFAARQQLILPIQTQIVSFQSHTWRHEMFNRFPLM
jgi:hypothetical protein